jgi:hypothetical protein
LGYEPNELPLLHPALPPGVTISQTRFVPPILFKPSSVSDQALPDLAATDLSSVTQPRRCRCDETERNARPAHLAPDCTLAQPTALPHVAGRLLPYRFTPYPRPWSGPLAGLFSVAVVVTPHSLQRALTSCFVRQSRPSKPMGWESGSSSAQLLDRAATDSLVCC